MKMTGSGVNGMIGMEGGRMEESIGELRQTFRSGKTRSAAWRKAQLKALLQLLRDNENKIFEALKHDLGKHPVESYRDELGVVEKSVKYSLSHVDEWMAPKKSSLPLIFFPAKGQVLPEPLGLVLIISSWNFPISLALDPVIGAISAGNSVALKPSEQAPACSSFLANTIPLYLDSKAIKVIEGGAEISQQLLQQKWDKIFFTGSPSVARIVMSAAVKHLTPVTIELGGKCPTIFDYLSSPSDTEVAVKRVVGGKWGPCNGQACIGVDYVLVEEKFASHLIEMLKKTIKKFYGENPKQLKDISKIVNKHHFQRLHNLLKEPLVAASIVHGGLIDEEKLFIEPTILLDPPLDAEIMTEEIFGPLWEFGAFLNLRRGFVPTPNSLWEKMGRATRWLRGLLGMKKDKEQVENSTAGDRKEKKRWSFAKPGRDTSGVGQNPVNFPANIPVDSAWLRSYISETEKEQNKHAIAVAAATAAAADAAVAAAQAAVAVVRLTSHGRGTLFGGGRDRWAATKIQTVFRGYLARKAHRALKGLVKLQALVRGFLVRKRAAATLHSMQALIRAQAAVRSQRTLRARNKENRFPPEMRPRRSIERFEETRSEFHSKRMSTSFETSVNAFDESPKIVEIDTFKPKSRSRRMMNTSTSDSGEDLPYQTLSSPLPCPVPARLSIPDCRNFQDFEWCFTGEECRFSTAQSTPRLANTSRAVAPVTPAKSVCGDSFFRPYSNFPNYMANTQSFKAKLRSHSAPKQRPEPGPKRRFSLNEIMASRTSLSGVRMQRSCSQVQEALNF